MQYPRQLNLLPRLVPAVLAACLIAAPAAHAQPQQPSNDGPQEDRRPRWEIPDDATSKNNKMLEGILKRFPDSDKNKDGVLDATEARAFIEEQRKKWRDRRDRRSNRPEVTIDDLAYGPTSEHAIDLYLATSEEPTPLVIFFHGGQFVGGDEDNPRYIDIKLLLEAGISIASVDYRDMALGSFPMPFEDAARAVQFLRFYADKFNVDPEKFATFGEEAGGNIALYIALHDDLAQDLTETEETQAPEPVEPQPEPTTADETADADGEEDKKQPDPIEELVPHDDPGIAAMSTRVSACVARHVIASYDPNDWKKNKLPLNKHERMFERYFDIRSVEPFDDPDAIKLAHDVSPIHLASRGDPELLLITTYDDLEIKDSTTWTIMRHHPKQLELIASASRGKGNRATVRYKGMKGDSGKDPTQFLIEKLK